MSSIKEYLLAQGDAAIDHVVVGNRAGDADSIISALTLAYIDSVFAGKPKTAVVSITKKDLLTQRPEVSFLFRTLGLDSTIESLRFIDDPIITSPIAKKSLTLVDHNRAEEAFGGNHWEVVEMLDHHFDEQKHLETCSGDSRHIAFENDKATSASTCTLIAERLNALKQPKYHSTLATLLLGTILLDSVNMIPQAGKGTPRDAAAIQDLLDNTDWSTISKEAVSAWWKSSEYPAPTDSKPVTTKMFESLQAAKFDPNFWQGLSVNDALRLDYKLFSAERKTSLEVHLFGASAILMPMDKFLQKPNVYEAIHQYMTTVAQVEVLAILFFFTCPDSGENRRQLILCGTNSSETGKMVDELVLFLQKEAVLILEEEEALCLGDKMLTLRLFNQQNVKASRKQVAPLLIKFFESL